MCTFLQSPPSTDANATSYNITYCDNGCVETSSNDAWHGYHDAWCHQKSTLPVTCTNLPWMSTDGEKILVEVCSDGCSTLKSYKSDGTEKIEGSCDYDSVKPLVEGDDSTSCYSVTAPDADMNGMIQSITVCSDGCSEHTKVDALTNMHKSDERWCGTKVK